MAIVLLSVAAPSVRAIPAWPGLHTVLQPDGTSLSLRLLGDEYAHSYVTTDGWLVGPDADGIMHYVTAVSDDGRTELSAAMAHNASLRSAEERQMLLAEGQTDFASYYRKVAGTQWQTAPQGKSARRSLGGTSFPTQGEVRGLVLLVEFADNAFQPEYDRALFERQLNEEGYADYAATGSARDYFIAQSMGRFTPRFDVAGPLRLSRPMAYYGASSRLGNDANPGEMVSEACRMAHDSLSIDFSQYDFDGDGDVDFVFVLYAGYGENYGAPSTTVWPHMSSLRTLNVDCRLDGKTIDRYACSCELNGSSGTELDGIGAVCHEFSHVLGLPDFYNTYNTSLTQLGSWDVMDAGSYNNNSRTPPSFTAFERYSLGWMELTEIDTPSDSIVLDEITRHNVGLRISTASENEFFTLENHQQEGWDCFQPGRGLMIIHVSYSESAWRNNSVNSGATPRYDLVEADGTQGYDLETDLFPTPANDMFTDYSTPGSTSWSGVPTEKGVTRIRQNGDGTVSFRFMLDRLARPVVLDPTEVTSHSFRLNWEPVEGAVGYDISLREVLPDSLEPLLLDEDFSLMTGDAYPKSGYQTIDQSLDDYCHRPGWQGSDVYASNGYVRIGSYGKSGWLQTPGMTSADADGWLTAAFRAVSYPGKKVSYTVSLTDADTGDVIASHDLKADKNETHQLLRFQSPANVRLRFATQNERLFLSSVRMLSGQADSLEVWTAGPRQWTADSITATSYVVDSLESSRTYACTLVALATGGLTSSLPTAEQLVTTAPLETSIRQPPSTFNPPPSTFDLPPSTFNPPPSTFDVTGRPVVPSSRGLIILRRVCSDGTVEYIKYLAR